MQLYLNDKNIYYLKHNILHSSDDTNLILNKLKYETNVILFQYNLSNEKYKIYNEKNNFNIDYDCLYTYYKCTSKSECLTK